MKPSRTRRVRILYLLLVILIGISVVPLWIYTSNMTDRNREYLETQENILQSTTSQSLAREISLYLENLQQRLKEFFEEVVPLAASMDGSKYGSDPRLREALQQMVTDWPMALYATVLNTEARGVQAGGYNAAGDAFLRKALEAAFIAARQGTLYQSDPITVVRNGKSEPVMVWARPITSGNDFRGMVAVVVTLAPVLERLEETRRTGLEAYIVDNSGRLVASNRPDNVPGKDMVNVPIVQMFLAWRGAARATETRKFPLAEGGNTIEMLGTYSPIQNVNWGVIVQKRLSDAYFVVDEMRRRTVGWGIVVILLNVVVAIFAAKSVTKPLESLTRTARSFAQREYTERADVRSRIEEVAELAEGFNLAGQEIQNRINDLERAAKENRQLFMESIEMIAAAVDAKDPYTKGHTKRVSQYSVILGRELGLSDDEVEKILISATLHDVGKIGVEDRVLKKPGVLTNEEFDLMKRHTVMGFEIVRQVKQLAEMLPGIRWHHEALNGKGYPDGVTGDELPLMVRIISVADTFDAVTTDRPYQKGRDFPQALEILRKHAGTKYDPIVVDALHAAYTKGDLRGQETRRQTLESVPQPTA
ncbi:MAG: HD domain-containing protein [Acidobacteriia bacterium]|nr:HD domain-containing protein [Terriglobia bacterium]